MTQKRTYKRYPKEFKEEAVALIREQGYTLAQAAESVGVSAALLGKWKSKLEAQLDAEELSDEEYEELKQLRREVKQLRMEKEILKKASVDSNGHCNSFTKILIFMSTNDETNKTYIYPRRKRSNIQFMETGDRF